MLINKINYCTLNNIKNYKIILLKRVISMNISHFSILGERCSGTNYLEQLILHNFELTYTKKFGHKHFFGYNNFNQSDNVLFIGIIRNPVYWINSFSKELYHVPEVNHNIITFLFNEFYSINDELSIPKNNQLYINTDYQKGYTK